MVDKIFNNFEEFVNSNELMLIKAEKLQIVWAVRGANGKTIKGFAKIGRKHVPFYATFMGKNDLTMWIPGIGHIMFPEKFVKGFLGDKDEC